MSKISQSERKTLTRADLRESVYLALPHLSRSEVMRIVTEVFEEITVALEQGESVKLRRFGTFSIRKKPERPGRNPRTMESAVISARRVVSFSPSPCLRSIVNGEEINDDEEE